MRRAVNESALRTFRAASCTIHPINSWLLRRCAGHAAMCIWPRPRVSTPSASLRVVGKRFKDRFVSRNSLQRSCNLHAVCRSESADATSQPQFPPANSDSGHLGLRFAISHHVPRAIRGWFRLITRSACGEEVHDEREAIHVRGGDRSADRPVRRTRASRCRPSARPPPDCPPVRWSSVVSSPSSAATGRNSGASPSASTPTRRSWCCARGGRASRRGRALASWACRR